MPNLLRILTKLKSKIQIPNKRSTIPLKAVAIVIVLILMNVLIKINQIECKRVFMSCKGELWY